MTLTAAEQANRNFLRNLDIPDAPRTALFAVDGVDDAVQPVFDAAKQQAVVVGADVVSFAPTVEPEFRQAITDSALVAQLAADARIDQKQDPIAWFDAYFAVLGGLGWTTQVRDTAEYRFAQDGLEVHEAILEVVTAFLGPIPGAAALVQLTLKSLKSMNSDSPWITLFNKKSEHADTGRFQFTLIRRGEGKELLADAMCFGLNAEKKVTQILFFKVHKNRARLRRSLATVSIGEDALEGLRPLLKQKIEAHRKAFVLDLPLAI